MEGIVPSEDVAGAEKTKDPEPTNGSCKKNGKSSHVYLGLDQAQPHGPSLFVHWK